MTKAHKITTDPQTGKMACTCGYQAKRDGFVTRHLRKYDPKGLDARLGYAPVKVDQNEVDEFLNSLMEGE